MKKITFRVKLLTDIVLNQRAATQGNQESLDFIPGNNFLGITASELYPLKGNAISEKELKENFILFHSGKVRFGDAHPVINDTRTLRIPASFHYAKAEGDTRVLIHHKMPQKDNAEIRKFEPKQFRSGFYNLSDIREGDIHLHTIKADIQKTFAIKSAYDREMRRSADSQMYGYESLKKGSLWEFSVFADEDVEDVLMLKVKTKLAGVKRIGRSRTAQYGLIEIEEVITPKAISNNKLSSDDFLLIYADARLIFLDKFGLPTFQPEEEQLCIKNGRINWQKSQIRTFQYAPWNYRRQARDTDRCGIEKGSVFYIERTGKEPVRQESEFIGFYQNEGFGKILINPVFLESKYDIIGESRFFVNTQKTTENDNKSQVFTDDYKNPVYCFLRKQYEKNNLNESVYSQVNNFVEKHKNKFLDNEFSSQWGCICSLAMRYSTKKDRDEKIRKYISEGVAKEKWEKFGRLNVFNKFISDLDERSSQLALVNLAREMSKIRKEEK